MRPEKKTPSALDYDIDSDYDIETDEDGLSSICGLNDWDPLYFKQTPPPQHHMRVRRDILDVVTNPPPGVHVVPVDSKADSIHALVMGPTDTPYEGGFFHFLMQCPQQYPFKPPRVRLMTTGGGSVRFSPNLCSTGMVSLAMLGTTQGEPWSPRLRLENVLGSIKSLLSKEPYFDQPGVYRETWEGESERYSRAVRHETVRVAVCDAVEACLNGSSQCPPYLGEVMMNSFLDSYDKYVDVVESNMQLTRTVMCDQYGDPVGEYRYDTLLWRLRKLKRAVQEMLKPVPKAIT
ncbi:hypothetical protein HPB50_003527 [Hyalomma asiaticum]|uniref:Uncharacterized protein n=1 Tax=Hyalomma asiaticum TaxID=266040 RepID=A0ACB7RS91_HYAAI|nr:hypothetical protein HPB50_003527 [Hyalomma asiaticum]